MIVRSHSLDVMSLNCSNVEEQRRAPTETIETVKDVRITSLWHEQELEEEREHVLAVDEENNEDFVN